MGVFIGFDLLKFVLVVGDVELVFYVEGGVGVGVWEWMREWSGECENSWNVVVYNMIVVWGVEF